MERVVLFKRRRRIIRFRLIVSAGQPRFGPSARYPHPRSKCHNHDVPVRMRHPPDAPPSHEGLDEGILGGVLAQ